MTYLSERVGAFVLRQTTANQHELLLFQHPTCEDAPLQIPGGGLEVGESLETALYREIYEESGLTNLILLRKLGIVERCWLDTQKTVRRHYFLLLAPSSTANRWHHVVQGHGPDTDLCFSYFWLRPSPAFTLAGGSGMFLNAHHIPELYDRAIAPSLSEALCP